MKVEILDVESAFTFQLQMILSQIEAEIKAVYERADEIGNEVAELKMLGQEPDDEINAWVEMAARFMATTSTIKAIVGEELAKRKFELN